MRIALKSLTLAAVAVAVMLVMAAPAPAVFFSETFDTNAVADFYESGTPPANYTPWDEVPFPGESQIDHDNGYTWSVVGQELVANHANAFVSNESSMMRTVSVPDSVKNGGKLIVEMDVPSLGAGGSMGMAIGELAIKHHPDGSPLSFARGWNGGSWSNADFIGVDLTIAGESATGPYHYKLEVDPNGDGSDDMMFTVSQPGVGSASVSWTTNLDANYDPSGGTIDVGFMFGGVLGITAKYDNLTMAVPEPSSIVLLGTGLLMSLLVGYRRRMVRVVASC